MFGRAFDFVVLNIVPPFALIMFIISGIMFFTAIGDSSKLEKSKSIMISTVIGIVLISLAWLITVQIYSIFGADESYTKDWWEICKES
jgi:sorbitol-specific phosphotransferase system component IIBC